MVRNIWLFQSDILQEIFVDRTSAEMVVRAKKIVHQAWRLDCCHLAFPIGQRLRIQATALKMNCIITFSWKRIVYPRFCLGQIQPLVMPLNNFFFQVLMRVLKRKHFTTKDEITTAEKQLHHDQDFPRKLFQSYEQIF